MTNTAIIGFPVTRWKNGVSWQACAMSLPDVDHMQLVELIIQLLWTISIDSSLSNFTPTKFFISKKKIKTNKFFALFH